MSSVYGVACAVACLRGLQERPLYGVAVVLCQVAKFSSRLEGLDGVVEISDCSLRKLREGTDGRCRLEPSAG